MAASALPTVTVCLILRETPEVILRFLAFYRAAGADAFLIFYDGDPPPLPEEALVGVTILSCDETFWRGAGLEVTNILNLKQPVAYAMAMEWAVTDWVFFVDADEFLIGPDGGPGQLGRLLAEVPAGVPSLRVPNVEAVWGPGDNLSEPFGCSYARRPLHPKGSRHIARALYGEMARYMRNGLVGHSDGKHFLRKGAAFDRVEPHLTRLGGKPVGVWTTDLGPLAAAHVMVHYDAIGLDRWIEKWRRRVRGATPARAALIEAVRAAMAQGPGPTEALFRRLYGLRRWQVAALALIGRVTRIDPFGRDSGRARR